MRARYVVFGIGLLGLACGGGGDGTAAPTDGGIGTGGASFGWTEHWRPTDQPKPALALRLAVLGPKHYLLVEKFTGTDNPTGTGVYRSLEIFPDGKHEAGNMDQAVGTILFYAAYGGGAGLLMEEANEIVSYYYSGSSWQRSVVTASGSQMAYAVGSAVDGSPRLAIRSSATPASVKVFAASGPAWTDQTYDLPNSKGVGGVAEDHAGRTHFIDNDPPQDVHHVFAAGQEVETSSIPVATGDPYFLFNPDDSVRVFNANTLFDNYTGLLSELGSDATWSDYNAPIKGLPREHALFDGDLEHMWGATLYACRRGGAEWTSIELKGHSVTGFSKADDLKRDGDLLVAAKRGGDGDRIVVRPLADCLSR